MVARTTTDEPVAEVFTIPASEKKLIKQKWFNQQGKEHFYEEFLLFAAGKQLSPLAREVMPLFFWDDRNKNFRMTPYTSIDGMRKIADRSGQYAGSDDYLYDGDCSLHDWLSQFDGNPKTATVTVFKMVDGARCPFTASAAWDTYYPGPKKPNWNKKGMKMHMLGKCAESLALGKAFPAETAGLYISEEMDQADADIKATEPAPERDDGKQKQEREPDTPTTPKQDWGNVEYFRDRYYNALHTRKIPYDQAPIIAGAEARNNKIKDYASATPEQRQALVEKVRSGAMDAFKDVKPPPATADVGDGPAEPVPAGGKKAEIEIPDNPETPAPDEGNDPDLKLQEDENACITLWMTTAKVDAAVAVAEMNTAIARITKSDLKFSEMSPEQVSKWRQTLEKHGTEFVTKWHEECTK